jgi:hypothetical protein
MADLVKGIDERTPQMKPSTAYIRYQHHISNGLRTVTKFEDQNGERQDECDEVREDDGKGIEKQSIH